MSDPNNEIDSLRQEIDRITHRLDHEVETYDEEYQELDERRDQLEARLKVLLSGGKIPSEDRLEQGGLDEQITLGLERLHEHLRNDNKNEIEQWAESVRSSVQALVIRERLKDGQEGFEGYPNMPEADPNWVDLLDVPPLLHIVSYMVEFDRRCSRRAGISDTLQLQFVDLGNSNVPNNQRAKHGVELLLTYA